MGIIELIAVLVVFSDLLIAQFFKLSWQLHKHRRIYNQFYKASVWLVDKKRVVFVQTPSVDVTVAVDCERAEPPAINLNYILKQVYFYGCFLLHVFLISSCVYS